MKRLEKIYKITALFALLLATGCEDKYEPIDTVSDTAWYNSESSADVSLRYQMNVGEYISFMSASQGVIYREWKIDNNYATFLSDSFDPSYEANTQLDTSKGSSSSNAIEAVYFGVAGPTTVTLTERFNEYVTSYDNTGNEATYNSDGGYWEIVTVYTINVFSPLQPAFRLYTLDDEGKVKDELLLAGDETLDVNKVFSVELGEVIYFEDKTVEVGFEEGYNGFNSYYAYSRAWSVAKSNELTSTDQYCTFTFDTAGEYSGFTLKCSRSAGGPTNNMTEVIPVTVKAAVAEARLKTASISATSTKVLTITSNRELQDVQASAFSVTVKDKDGDDLGYTIESADIDYSNNMNINLTLSGYLYEGDQISVSYTYTDGCINDVNGTDLAAASKDFTVKNTLSEMLSQGSSTLFKLEESTDSSFATSSSTSKWWSAATSNIYRALNPYSKSTTIDGYVDYDTDYSIVFDTTSSGILATTTEKAVNTKASTVPNLTIPAGKYRLSYNIYYEGSASPDINTYSIIYNSTEAGGMTALFSEGVQFPETADCNKWVEWDEDIEFTTSATNMQLKFTFVQSSSATITYINKTFPANVKVYIDDIKLTPVRQ